MVRATLSDPTTVTLDRGVGIDDVTEVAWQVVELADGSSVQHGSSTMASGDATATATIAAVATGRSVAFASSQFGGGQGGGETSAASGGVIGVASATVQLSGATQVSLVRTATGADATFTWFVVSWGLA
jgi:hypothetical protein